MSPWIRGKVPSLFGTPLLLPFPVFLFPLLLRLFVLLSLPFLGIGRAILDQVALIIHLTPFWFTVGDIHHTVRVEDVAPVPSVSSNPINHSEQLDLRGRKFRLSLLIAVELDQ